MKKTLSLVFFMLICIYVTSFVGVVAGDDNKTTVKFDFDGLQAIAFGDPNKISDGILDVAHHVPKIEITQNLNGKVTKLYTISSQQLKGSVINMDVPNKNVAAKRYFSPDMTKDKSDFRWCLDIENDLFQKRLYLKEDKLFCKIHFNTGTFYAENVTEEKYQFMAGNMLHSLKRQFGVPTAIIELGKGDNLVISGLATEISLPYNAGVNYQIKITDLPPPSMSSMDHFDFYYDYVKTNVPRFVPVEVKRATFDPRPIACGAAIFGKSVIK